MTPAHVITISGPWTNDSSDCLEITCSCGVEVLYSDGWVQWQEARDLVDAHMAGA